ncbi:hypothetical protein EBN15_19625 [Xanthomonas cucurbitae]|nr:hypothetical protein EBN15_19625 [Xanthomonas cucurbitae]
MNRGCCTFAWWPYPHPNPRSAPRPALAARALQGTRAMARKPCLLAPTGEGLFTAASEGAITCG